MLRRTFAALSLSALSLSTSGAPAAVQAQGAKVAKIVVGFPAGQGIDLVSRIVAEALKDELGETVIVENKPGQGGSIALGQVARAAPDGATILISAMAALVMAPHLYKNVTYDTLTSFAPVGRVGDLPLVLVVNPSLPVKTLPELIAYAKANPDKHTPTIAERGFPGFEANAWLGMLLPAGTPKETVDRLAAALNKIVRSPEIQKRFLAVGTLSKASTSAEFAAFLEAEYARWGKAIAESGIKAD